MTLQITNLARARVNEIGIEPQFLLKIDGIDTCFGSTQIYEKLRIGDPRFFIGNDFTIGGLIAIDDQSEAISNESTSTKIKQQLEPEKGAVSSVSTLKVRLVDFSNSITKIISPGVTLDDILYVRATLYVGFSGTSFPDDFTQIHAGVIDSVDSGAGFIDLNIAHPDQKKRQEIYPLFTTAITNAIGSSDTSILLDDISTFLFPKTSDTITKFYIRIEDELIEYSTFSGSTLTSVTRGALGTTAVAHDAGEEANTFYSLEGNTIELALQVMMSSDTEFYKEDVSIENIVDLTASLNLNNAIFFQDIDVEKEYGLTLGDYVRIQGATNGANNIDKTPIIDIVQLDSGSYIQLDNFDINAVAVSLVSETMTTGSADFSSQYNVLTDGLGMTPQEVDVDRHDFLRRTFLGSAPTLIYLKDTTNGKELIEKELYLPFAMYAVPRGGKSSVSLHIPPIPTDQIEILDSNKIKDPSKIVLKRSTTKNFYNTIIHKYDEDVLEEDFRAGSVVINSTSLARIKSGRKSLTIEAKALRSSLQATSLTIISANRMLQRYKFAAEYFDGINVLFKSGFTIDVADIVSIDFTDLKVSNTTDGNRDKKTKLFEVVNKTVDLKKGAITLSLVDTNFSDETRYCLISPASLIKSGSSTTSFVIKDSFSSKFGPNEFKKWEDFIGVAVKVRSADFVTQSDSFITNVVGNTITVSPALSFTPSADMIMEFDDYDAQTLNEPLTDRVKLIYGFMNDATFADGVKQYQMI